LPQGICLSDVESVFAAFKGVDRALFCRLVSLTSRITAPTDGDGFRLLNHASLIDGVRLRA
jgi:hypothetical protein